MVTYWSSYNPNVSDLNFSLIGFLKEEIPIQWRKSQDIAFQDMKDQIGRDVFLTCFDATKDVVLQVDVSQVNLAAVSFQDNNLVAI